MVPVRLRGPAGELTLSMLVDSGADVSMIQLGHAQRLGLHPARMLWMWGVSQGLWVSESRVAVRVLAQEGPLSEIVISVHVPTVHEFPPLTFLGREGFFSEYEITFRAGRVPAEGTVTIGPPSDTERA
jgi:hypothetical protein